ncbi:polymer-forming cytoskeletal protein [Chondromyces crocatus]|uniref:DUF8173 domain-containing protein n=1 Tax=Chondromyces crocatus TaxID=52 RepID=A0A0K1E6P4_CHOCO|nr:polymer-forming cytoskeletal protein [Chondromyces crocatus]AKT36357.1 uncharacterized protein CMC5_004700 [Chondromyces crocatus]
MRSSIGRGWATRGLGACAVAALGLSVSGVASATVHREGAWPDSDETVSLELQNVPRSEALKRLARAAGWSVIVNAPASAPVDLHVTAQPAGKVLDLLLADGEYVARRDGSLIAITPSSRPGPVPMASLEPFSPPMPPLPLAPPSPEPPVERPAGAVDPAGATGEPSARPDATVDTAAPADEADPSLAAPSTNDPASQTKVHDDDDDDGDEASRKARGRDRTVAGSSLRIEKEEVVHDVSLVGGSLEVLGTVTGDINVAGGSVNVRSGARVRGDVMVMGGSLNIEDAARIDGNIDVTGGSIRRGQKAVLGGDVNATRDEEAREGGSAVQRFFNEAGDAVMRMAFLFALGAVALALAPNRMDQLKVEIAAHPMRSFARGVIGVLSGVVMLCALSITVIGIPFAVIALLWAVLAVFVAACSVLETAGAGLIGHRTRNPYIHLAIGCAALLVLGAIPYLGTLLWSAVLLIGAGALVTTRAAGLLKPRTATGAATAASHPFRSLFG